MKTDILQKLLGKILDRFRPTTGQPNHHFPNQPGKRLDVFQSSLDQPE
jgi:hypothetical protein